MREVCCYKVNANTYIGAFERLDRFKYLSLEKGAAMNSCSVFFFIAILCAPSIAWGAESVDVLRKGAWACGDMVSTRKANAGVQVSECLYDYQKHLPVKVLRKEPGYSVRISDPATGRKYIALPGDVIRMSRQQYALQAKKGTREEVLVIAQNPKTPQPSTPLEAKAEDSPSAPQAGGPTTGVWKLEDVQLEIIRMDPPNNNRKSHKVKYRVENLTEKHFKSIEFTMEFYDGERLVNSESFTVKDLPPQGVLNKTTYFDDVAYTAMQPWQQRAKLQND